jgi:hypothetical protein
VGRLLACAGSGNGSRFISHFQCGILTAISFPPFELIRFLLIIVARQGTRSWRDGVVVLIFAMSVICSLLFICTGVLRRFPLSSTMFKNWDRNRSGKVKAKGKNAEVKFER